MRIKKKFNSVVEHVKSHPVFYGYLAGVVVTATAIGIAQSKITKKFLSECKLVDLNYSLDRITNEGLTGLYFPMDDVNTLLLIPAPEDFQP